MREFPRRRFILSLPLRRGDHGVYEVAGTFEHVGEAIRHIDRHLAACQGVAESIWPVWGFFDTRDGEQAHHGPAEGPVRGRERYLPTG